MAQPHGLGLGIRASEPLARTLYREPHPAQQARDVMVVVADPKAAPDEIADHRTGLHPAREARSLRASLDDGREFRLLRLAQAWRRPWSFGILQPLGPHGLVPLKPAIDGAPRHLECFAQGDDLLPIQVAQDGLGPPSGRQVLGRLGLLQERPELRNLFRRPPLRTDSLTILRASHDHPLERRDRGTLILARSSVNSLDPVPGDPV